VKVLSIKAVSKKRLCIKLARSKNEKSFNNVMTASDLPMKIMSNFFAQQEAHTAPVESPDRELTCLSGQRPVDLIATVSAKKNRFSKDQLVWLEQALSQQLQNVSEPFYCVLEDKIGVRRPLEAMQSLDSVWCPRMSDWFNGKTILVTGASGFIGKYTLKALEARGVGQIIGVDLKQPGDVLLQNRSK
jgi:hypothetical protein